LSELLFLYITFIIIFTYSLYLLPRISLQNVCSSEHKKDSSRRSFNLTRRITILFRLQHQHRVRLRSLRLCSAFPHCGHSIKVMKALEKVKLVVKNQKVIQGHLTQIYSQTVKLKPYQRQFHVGYMFDKSSAKLTKSAVWSSTSTSACSIFMKTVNENA